MPVHLLPSSQPQRPIDLEPERSALPLTRRRFLVGMAAIGVAPFGVTIPGSEVPLKSSPPEGWYALVSDIHIAADPARRVFDQNMADHLKSVVADILVEKELPRGVVIAGDLAVWDGQPGDYQTLLKLLDPLREASVPIHMALGNHDQRTRFREVLPVGSLCEGRQVSAVDGAGIRFVLLDSLDQVAQAPGQLGAAQREWLAKDLDAHAKTPTVLVVHHHPNFVPWSTVPGLRDSDGLMKIVLPRQQVKAVVFGHTHSFHIHNESGLYLINLPAVAYSLDHRSRLGYCRFRPEADRAECTLRGVQGKEWAHRKLSLKWR
jgi:Icc protein